LVSVIILWVVSAGSLLLLSEVLGRLYKKSFLFLLRNRNGEYSLSQFQVVLWSWVILSLLIAVFAFKLLNSVDDPLEVAIPDELLWVLGISSATIVSAKSLTVGMDMVGKEVVSEKAGSNRRAKLNPFSGFIADLIMDKVNGKTVVDFTRFQNLIITMMMVLFFIWFAAKTLWKMDAKDITALPSFSSTLIVLIGISHAGYIIKKVPDIIEKKSQDSKRKENEDTKPRVK